MSPYTIVTIEFLLSVVRPGKTDKSPYILYTSKCLEKCVLEEILICL